MGEPRVTDDEIARALYARPDDGTASTEWQRNLLLDLLDARTALATADGQRDVWIERYNEAKAETLAGREAVAAAEKRAGEAECADDARRQAHERMSTIANAAHAKAVARADASDAEMSLVRTAGAAAMLAGFYECERLRARVAEVLRQTTDIFACAGPRVPRELADYIVDNVRACCRPRLFGSIDEGFLRAAIQRVFKAGMQTAKTEDDDG